MPVSIFKSVSIRVDFPEPDSPITNKVVYCLIANYCPLYKNKGKQSNVTLAETRKFPVGKDFRGFVRSLISVKIFSALGVPCLTPNS
jgi:hypothetical protein